VTLSAEQRRFLLISQSLVPFVINVVLNGAIGWAMVRGAESVPLWGESSIGADTLGTSFFLPAITCLIVTPLVRGQVKKGKAPAYVGALAGWLQHLQRPLGVRAVALGLACIMLSGGLAVALLTAFGVEELGFAPFRGGKALYAGVLAAAVTPIIGLLALADRPGH
jgi:hypothetical protein